MAALIRILQPQPFMKISPPLWQSSPLPINCGKDSQLWVNFQGINKRSYNAVQDHLLGRPESPFWDNTATPEKETKAMIFAAALAEAITLSEKQMGSSRGDWAW